MRKEFTQWVASAILMVGLGLVAGYWLVPQQESLASIDITSIEYSPIAFNKIGTQSVQVRNVTGKPIDFAAHAECNCTNVEPAKATLEPGQSMQLQVHYRPKLIGNKVFSIEQSMVRFEFYDGRKVQLIVVPLTAHVLSPISRERGPLIVDQFGTTPASFQWQLSLASDVESLYVVTPPKFADEIRLVDSKEDALKKMLEGKTRSRFEIHETQDELVLAGVARGGKNFEVSIPACVRFQVPFQLTNETIYLVAGQPSRLGLEMLDINNYSSFISAISCEMNQVHVQGAQDSVWQVSTDLAESTTGYVKITVCTIELSSGKQLFTEHSVPVFIN